MREKGKNLAATMSPGDTWVTDLFLFFFFNFYLFMIVTQREREAETQAEGEAGSLQGT